MLARRLMVAGGGGAFAAPIPEQGRWVRQGAVITPSVAWEGTAALEPSVLYDGGFKMWYRAGYPGPRAMGYATSSDGLTWTKSGSNPIFGNGHGGEASEVLEPNVYKLGSTFYLYYNTTTVFKVATSTDGTTWTIVANPAMALPTNCTLWGNFSVWNEGGSTWKMMVEAYRSDLTIWITYYATSSDGETWTLGNGGSPLSSLAPDVGVGYSCPHFATDPKAGGSLYQGWYHSSASGDPAGSSNIYRAHSPDAITWTPVVPKPVFIRSGLDYETQQVADPRTIEVGGTSYLFYDADYDDTVHAEIKVATINTSLYAIVAGTT